MENSKKHIFFGEDELPLKVPAGGPAWEKMKEKLNLEMPVKKKKRKILLLFFFTGFVCLISLSLSLLKTKFHLVSESKNINVSNKINSVENIARMPDDAGNLSKAIVKKENPTKHQLTKKRNLKKELLNKVPGQAKASKVKEYVGDGNNQKSNNPVEKEVLMATEGSHEKTFEIAIVNEFGSDKLSIIGKKTDIKKTDSSKENDRNEDKEADEEEKDENNNFKLYGGLQWNFQIPLQGTRYYFKSANIKNTPWQQLVPGIWLTASKDRHKLGLELNPYYMYLLPAKAVNESITSSGSADTAIKSTTFTEINKLIGTSTNFTYTYNIKSAWWIQAGIQAQWWRKGITTSNVTREKTAIMNPTHPIIEYFKESHAIMNDDWDYINKFQLNINAGLEYQTKKWQATLRTGLPIAPISQTDRGPSRNLRTEFIFKWTLFNKTINSSK